MEQGATAGNLASARFASWLEPASLRLAAMPARSAAPETMLMSLVCFEGALAWEAGEPRSAVPLRVRSWGALAWLEGWDWACARYGRPARLD